MAKFNGGYKNDYVLAEMARFFGNTIKYYRGHVDDDDYFDPAVFMYGENAVEKEVIRVFGREELVRNEICRNCVRHEPGNGRSYGEGEERFCFCMVRQTDVIRHLDHVSSVCRSATNRCRRVRG